jgi:hypothetical protein
MSIEQIRNEAGRFQRKVQRRNLREYIAALAVILFFGRIFLRANDLLVRVGCGLIIAGVAYVTWHLLSKGSPGSLDENAGLSNWIDFRRNELVRQRDLLKSIWRWYLGPLIPGIAAMFLAFAQAVLGGHLHVKHPGVSVGVDGLFFVTVFLVAARLNARAARKLQRQIDDLDRQSGTGASESA